MSATLAKKILIVDDDSQIRGLLARRFSKLGLAVTERADGEEGLEAMNHEAFDCILLDFKMPKKTGFDVLAERSHTLNVHTPVCVLTSMPSDEATYRAKELGANYVLNKSTASPTDVINTIVLKALSH